MDDLQMTYGWFMDDLWMIYVFFIMIMIIIMIIWGFLSETYEI